MISPVVERTRQADALLCMLPVQNRVLNKKVKESIVSGRNCPAHAGFVERGIAEKKLSLGATGGEDERASRSRLSTVAQARLAFVTWTEVGDESLARRYLYSLLFKDRLRPG